MDHTLRISVSKKPAAGGIVPGDSVRELAISEVKEGGTVHGKSEVTA